MSIVQCIILRQVYLSFCWYVLLDNFLSHYKFPSHPKSLPMFNGFRMRPKNNRCVYCYRVEFWFDYCFTALHYIFRSFRVRTTVPGQAF